jgi:hypothetical protein
MALKVVTWPNAVRGRSYRRPWRPVHAVAKGEAPSETEQETTTA